MNGQEIIDVVKRIDGLSSIFAGIFLNNYIPTYLKQKRNIFFIVNTIENIQENTLGHWTMIHISTDKHLTFWCSYGFSVNSYGGAIKKFYHEYPYSKDCVLQREYQQNSSIVCGIYVIFFAHKMFLNIPIQKIKSYFSYNRKKNDSIMLKYFYKLTGKSFKSSIAYNNVI